MYPDHKGRARDTCVETCQRTSTLVFKIIIYNRANACEFQKLQNALRVFLENDVMVPNFSDYVE